MATLLFQAISSGIVSNGKNSRTISLSITHTILTSILLALLRAIFCATNPFSPLSSYSKLFYNIKLLINKWNNDCLLWKQYQISNLIHAYNILSRNVNETINSYKQYEVENCIKFVPSDDNSVFQFKLFSNEFGKPPQSISSVKTLIGPSFTDNEIASTLVKHHNSQFQVLVMAPSPKSQVSFMTPFIINDNNFNDTLNNYFKNPPSDFPLLYQPICNYRSL